MQHFKATLQTAVIDRHWRSREVLQVPAAAALAGATIVVCRWLPHIDVTTAAMLLVLVVEGTALRCGRMAAVAAAIVSSLGLHYVILPPPGARTASADHWTALLAFLITACAIASARTQASEKALETEIIRRSDELKSAVFSALAHDARGPLNSIKIGATAWLSDRPGSAAQRRELAGIILDEVDRMNRWIDDACEVSQVEAAFFTLNAKPHDVRDLVSDAVDDFGPRWAGRPIHIDIPDSVPMADCDGEMIQRVLKLLLDNAVKYSPPGAPVAISCASEEDLLVITVSDRGPGIPADEQGRIFEKHYRGAWQDPAVPGMGLGLASARQMLESQGGTIWVTNRPEGGAAFHFSLPAVIQITV